MMGDYDCIVIGGGPAGSTAASFLKLMGRRVLLLERECFPRHHVGESMIAATIDILAEIGLEDKLAAAGFPVKSGGCFIWGNSEDPWCIRFEEVPGRPTSYQVKRDVFDTLLLEHSASLGVDVRQGHRVRDLLRDQEGGVIGVTFTRPDGTHDEARAALTIDASGLSAVVANRVSRRRPVEELRNMALYGYWCGEHAAPATLGGDIKTTDRYNIIIKWVGPGWLWFIPLGIDNLISVGYVAPRDSMPGGGSDRLESHFLERVNASAEFTTLLTGCTYTEEFHAVRDWSYCSERMAGQGYFAVGDAACFVDPILSSGVFLAVLYGKLCACAANTCLQEPELADIAQEWYEALYEDSYHDYLQMARFWYYGDRKVTDWMHEARVATVEDTRYSDTDRASFLGLATGNVHAHPDYVHRHTLRSRNFPARLRKSPLLGQLRAMGNALVAHAPGAEDDNKAQDVQRSMKSSLALKKKVARLFSERPELHARLTDGSLLIDPENILTLKPDADLSIEIVSDSVAVTAAARGRRRRLDAVDVAILEQLSASFSPAEVALAGLAPAERVHELCADLVAAGILMPISHE